MFKLIFSGVFLFFALLFVLCGMLKGRKYKFQYSVSRIIVVALSAVLSMVLSALLSWLLGSVIFNVIEGSLPSDEVRELLNNLPTAPDAVRALVAMLVAPLIFVAVFLIVRAILNCLSGALCRLILKIGKKSESPVPSEEQNEEENESEGSKKERKRNRHKEFLSHRGFDPAGAVCGAVCGFLIYVVLLIPTVGAVSTANSAVRLAGASDDGAIRTVYEITDAAAENVGAKTVKFLGGDLIYSGLTTYPVNGRMASLAKETKLLNAVGTAAISIADKDIPEKDSADALRGVSDAFEESTVIPMLLSELLSAASDDWSSGEEFCGIAPPRVGSDFDSVVKDMMLIMKDSDYDNIHADVRTVVNSLAIFVENDAFEAMRSENGAVAILKNEPLISSVMLEILENERLSTLVNSITNMGMSVLSQRLGLSEDDTAMYEGFIEDMSSEYIRIKSEGLGAKETIDSLSKSVEDIYDDYGIAISGGVSACIATDMLTQLSDGDPEEIKEFFSTHTDISNSMDSGSDNGITYLSTERSDTAKALSVTDKIAKQVSPDITLSQLNVIVMEELSAVLSDIDDQTLKDISSQISDGMYKDIQEGELKYKSAAFDGAVEFGNNSVRITREDLKIEATDITDKKKEAEAIAKMFGLVFSIIDEFKGEFDVSDIVERFGPVLDAANDCEMMGQKCAATLLTAILQSDAVRGNVGFSMIQATDLAGSVNSNSEKDGESYTALLKALGNTVDIIRESSNEGSNSTESIAALMKDMTPASAEVLQQFSMPEIVKNYGVSEESAQEVSDMFSDMFGNMSDAKEAGMSDEEYAKESAAINDLMSVAMGAVKDSGNSTFGEESSTGVTASEFVDRATNSTVISTTLVNTVYADGSDSPKSDPLNLGRELSDNEKEELVTAIDTKWKGQLSASNDAEANEQYQRVLTSIASLVNVDVNFSGDNVSLAK